MRLKTIQNQIILWTGSCLLVTLIAIISYAIYSNEQNVRIVKDELIARSQKDIENKLLQVAQSEIKSIKMNFLEASNTANTLAKMLKASVNENLNIKVERDAISGFLHSLLQEKDKFLGVFTVWETNKFDGLDSLYEGFTSNGSDENGRFMPLIFKSNNKIKSFLANDCENINTYTNGIRIGEYYLKPKSSKRIEIIGPYKKNIDNKLHNVLSFSVPIIYNNTFHGVTGVHISMDFLIDNVNKIKKDNFDNKSRVRIISHTGKIVADSDSFYTIGKFLDDLNKKDATLMTLANKQNSFVLKLIDNNYNIFVPIPLKEINNNWMISISVPKEIILKESKAVTEKLQKANNEGRNMILLFSLILLFISFLIILFIAKGIATPIRHASELAKKISNGNLPTKSFITNNIVELDVLSKSFIEIIASTKNVISQAQTIAKGSYEVNLLPRSESDDLTYTLTDMANSLQKYKHNIEAQDWITNGVAELNNIMRTEQNLKLLVEKIEDFIVKYLNGYSAITYIKEEFNKELKFISGYNVDKEAISKNYNNGDDLVKQVLHNKKLFIVDNIPTENMNLSSVYSSASPKNIVILPLIRESQIIGIIELASFYSFENKEKELLNLFGEIIAIVLHTAFATQKVNNLLAETQRQQEELQDTNEELEERTYLIDKQNKELEKKAEDLKQSNHYKSAFLANMSHEIRTPMNSILGFSEILKSEINDAKLSSYLDIIYKNGVSLLNLINGILDLSKVESGKLDINYAPLFLENLTQDINSLLNQRISDKGLDFIIDIDNKLPKSILLDETRLRQVLINLIGNSIKFTHNGSIKLIISCLNCNSSNTSSFDMKISVIDTGIGLSEESISSIFETFVQAREQKKAEYGGTGLGLSITKALVELMNGEISVISKLGEGTTFDIIFKDVEVAAIEDVYFESKEVKDLENVKFKNNTILVVDDISYNRDLVRGFLEEHNLIFFEAENGKEAVSMAKEVKPDLILMDMKMPVMDGFEATTIIKKDEQTKNIPIIALTASAMIEDKIEVNKICDSYLSKPVSKKELFNELMKYLPHTQKEPIAETADISETTTLSLEELKKYPEVLKNLSKEKETIDKLLNNMDLTGIENFGILIKEIGKKHNFIELLDFGQNLEDAADSIDIDIIETELNRLSKILKEI